MLITNIILLATVWRLAKFAALGVIHDFRMQNAKRLTYRDDEGWEILEWSSRLEPVLFLHP